MTARLEASTVLVTGGTGSIGRALVDELLTLNAKRIVVFSRDEMKHFNLRRELRGRPVDTVVGDVRDPRALDEVCARFHFDSVFHVAAMKHVAVCEDAPFEALLTNAVGTQNVLDAARHHGVKRVVVVSTDKAVLPTTVLGATKLLAERLTLAAARTCSPEQVFCTVRFGNVVGSRGSVIPLWLDALRNGRPLEITDPNVTRFAMSIAEAAHLVVNAGMEAQAGETFVLKMKAFALYELAAVVRERIAPQLGFDPGDVKTVTVGLVPGEKLHEELIADDAVGRLREDQSCIVIAPPWTVTPAGTGRATAVQRSDHAPRMSRDEIERLVWECVQANGSRGVH
ncbi:MAG: SDR family NAD(P)-dependent oxidoreductase [Dehalococcoidia bacterium]|nr:SDR family NAD(P)-dependent oxidoreductase [Dehalococcoidia bacterium]